MVVGIGSNGINGFMPPPLKFPVDVKATTNDPAMQIKVNGRQVSIDGIASNRGTVGSFAQFEVAGRRITIPLSGGTTGAQVLGALARKLPDGYSIQGNAQSFQIMRGGPSRPKPTTTEQIDTIFREALKQTPPGRGVVTTSELRAAFKVALSTGGRISIAEKTAIARNWQGLFTGAGYRATPAAQKEYARLQAKYELPVFPVR